MCKRTASLNVFLAVVAGCSSGSNGSPTPDASSDSSTQVAPDSASPIDSSAGDGPVDGGVETGSALDGAISDVEVIEAAVGPSGQLDPSFGSGGISSTDFFRSSDIANALVLQADGKIVTAGEAYLPLDGNGTYQVAVVRYDMHGGIDTSFGMSGKYVVDSPLYGAATAVALQSTGSIVVGGRVNQATDGSSQFGSFLTRLTSGGALDPSFAVGGTASWSFAGGGEVGIAGIAVAADDSLIVAGSYDKNPSGSFDYDIFLARFHADGTPDTSFGTAGISTIDLGTQYDVLSGVALRGDGRILVGGQTEDSAVLLQFSAQGVADATFGTSGRVDSPTIGRTDIFAFRLDPASDAAYLAGDTVVTEEAGNAFVAMVLRFTQQGAVDTSFGTAGMVTVPFGPGDVDFRSVLADPKGGVICGGEYGVSTPDAGLIRQWGLVRLDVHGALVPTFGSGGLSVSVFPEGVYDLSGLAWERDGSLLVAGSANFATTYEDFTVADYFP